MAQPYLRQPFSGLHSENTLGLGGGGQVYAISRNVAFKCPWDFGNADCSQQQKAKESREQIEREKVIFRLLMERPHMHIVRGILCTPEGIFMQRLEYTLHERLQTRIASPISTETQCRWISELVSAVAWLETLNIAYGDLRPVNMLLDEAESIHLCDFESAAIIGEEMHVAPTPYCKVDHNFDTPLAGPLNEQYAVGTCIYVIRTGYEPWHEIEGPLMVRKLINNEFPPTMDDHIFGAITLCCWHGCYETIADFETAIDRRLIEDQEKHEHLTSPARNQSPKSVTQLDLLAEVDKFIRAASNSS